MKSVTERPDLKNVMTTVIAMVYLAFLSSPFIIPDSFLYPVNNSSNNPIFRETGTDILTWAILLAFVILLISAWLYLIRDLIRQISLFFSRRTK